jgi:multiple sugar transport system permease protein
MNRSNLSTGLAFISPCLIGFFAFMAYPVVASLYFSFCDYMIFDSPEFIGMGNYRELMHDPLFWTSLYNTIYYTLFAVPGGMLFAFLLALILNMKVRGLAFYRTIFFLPSILPIVASSVLWIWILNPQYGLVNMALIKLGVSNPPGWLSDPAWSKPALILMSLWAVGGMMVIYLAALQDIPTQLYEAADLDGANTWHKIRHITIPTVSPVLFFTLIMGLITSFQYFTQAYVMTSGGPGNSTRFFAFYLFDNAFQYFRMGYASAMAWILFMVIVVSTFLVFRFTGKFIHYAGR